jgi:uncharacterized membrane protein
MIGFLLLLFAAYLAEFLLIAPAAILLILQLLVSRSELKREYPEDWLRYSLLFLLYEAIIVFMMLFVFRTVASSLSLGSIYTMLMAMLAVIALTIALRYMITRRYCYGTVLFTSGEWAGVSVKPDLFAKIAEADYAVANPLGGRVKKGDRVRVMLKSGLNRSAPREILEVVKDATVRKK